MLLVFVMTLSRKKMIIFQFFLKNSVVRPVDDFHHLQKGETACVEPS